MKGSVFDIISEFFLSCSQFNATAIEYWRHLPSLFFGFVVAFLFFKQFGETIYF